jgi:hypothetical protein
VPPSAIPGPRGHRRYIPADQVLGVADQLGGHSFDAPGAEFNHRLAPDDTGQWCTFETLLDA